MTQQEFLMVLGMALVTYVCRYPVLALVSRTSLPAPVLHALQFIPPAVLTAIIVPTVLMPDGTQVALSLTNSNLIAGVVTGLCAWRSRNLLLTIGAGMATVWLWRWGVVPFLA
jgi:branched-subunit amino acid transport protein